MGYICRLEMCDTSIKQEMVSIAFEFKIYQGLNLFKLEIILHYAEKGERGADNLNFRSNVVFL